MSLTEPLQAARAAVATSELASQGQVGCGIARDAIRDALRALIQWCEQVEEAARPGEPARMMTVSICTVCGGPTPGPLNGCPTCAAADAAHPTPSARYSPPIQPYDSDHTALVHVLWAAERNGVSVTQPDELAAHIMRSTWFDAVRWHASHPR